MFKNKELKSLRKMNNYTQMEIAEKIGKSQQTYAFYETGRVSPDLETLSKLSQIFNVPINYFLEEPQASEDNTIIVYGRGTGMKKYKLSPKKLKAIRALLDDDDESDDIDF